MHIILDFDGTFADLKVDWVGLRTELGVESIGEIWTFPREARNGIFEVVENYEILGIPIAPRLDLDFLKTFDTWSILTNNSENTVRTFLKRIRPQTYFAEPRMIVGRESLVGAKEDFFKFRLGVGKILDFDKNKFHSTLYVGDQNYERNHSLDLGLFFEDANPKDTLIKRLAQYENR